MKQQPEFVTVTPLVPAGASLEEGLEFYTRALGCEVVWQGGGMAGVRRGAVMLNLVENGDRARAENVSFSFGVPGRSRPCRDRK